MGRPGPGIRKDSCRFFENWIGRASTNPPKSAVAARKRAAVATKVEARRVSADGVAVSRVGFGLRGVTVAFVDTQRSTQQRRSQINRLLALMGLSRRSPPPPPGNGQLWRDEGGRTSLT
jgi:hypothetical protein